jgi:hypothetical protein
MNASSYEFFLKTGGINEELVLLFDASDKSVIIGFVSILDFFGNNWRADTDCEEYDNEDDVHNKKEAREEYFVIAPL